MTQDPNLIPVMRELPADLDTPVSVYLKVAGDQPSFLLESITGGQQVARYSFIGVNPRSAYVLRGDQWHVHSFGRDGATEDASAALPIAPDGSPLDALREELAKFQLADTPNMPRFAGGLVGYLGYEIVRFFESEVGLRANEELPDGLMLLADTLIAFDHAFGRLLLIANAFVGNGRNKEKAIADAEARLDVLAARLRGPIPAPTAVSAAPTSPELQSNFTQPEFEEVVRRAKEHIAAGDIFQVVPSQRFTRKTTARPFDIYRSLRRLNPSPYMFFFDFNGLAGDEDFHLIGASPEMHARFEDGIASVRPIAGTRARGVTVAEDRALEADLLADPKELAEHVMLMDLGRNDIGRVCEFGTVRVADKMVVERYSHVMHIVSSIEGKLRPEYDAFDLFQYTFPAGTVSGAPKIRAMQIIDDLEHGQRGTYAGAVGYFSFDGSMDTCIAIRALSMLGDTVYIQAGAGIVADSDPTTEFIETTNKARAVAEAVSNAEKL